MAARNLSAAAMRKAWKGSGLTGSDAFIWGTNALWFGSGYSRAKKEGHGTTSSVLRGVLEATLIDVVGWKAYFPLMAARGLPGAATSGFEGLARQSRQMEAASRNKPFQESTFIDTQQNYTMRQAGMALAQESKYNLQHAMLGTEAQHLHR